jgi:diaminopimelate decarboxylase
MNYRDTLRINGEGVLEIGGVAATDLARQFKTPLYVLDEKHIRDMCAVYASSLKEFYGENAIALYASKALCCKAIYGIVKEEGLGADVVSAGELYTAIKGGMEPEKVFFHGNNKTEEEIVYALKSGIGALVLNGGEEVDFVGEICAREKKTINVLLRVNPGVEAHTHHYIQTAKTDSKFGVAIGDATETVNKILQNKNLNLLGFHSHIGSQIFEIKPFLVAIDILFKFIGEVKQKFGYSPKALNLGGGYGIWYAEGDKKLKLDDYREFTRQICDCVKENIAKYGIEKPRLIMEPGRSVVGEAGVTLYTVGNIKEIKGIKKYVAIDGGMTDNPRYMLYQAKYSAIIANRANDPADDIVTIAGKCCESGDLIGENIKLGKAKRGDILAVFSTGAYNYAMASNYNRNPVPAVVLCKDGKAREIVKRQSLEDLARNDL